MLVDEGLGTLTEEDCRSRLSRARVGRIAVTMGALPVVLPVNFTTCNGDIVFRTGAGTKLTAAVNGTIVAFEIDEVDVDRRAGWSVLAVGPARLVVDQADIERLDELGLEPFAAGDRHHWVRVRPELLSGREVMPPL